MCGGIETGLLALTQLGIQVEEYHSYEILPEAIAVSSYHFPFVQHHGDLYEANFEELSQTIFKDIDLILAGTCCQSLSKTRRDDKNVNNGLKGKSSIFYKAIEALDFIKPKYFMFENVVPSDKEDLEEMSRLIGVQPIRINSEDFSPQNRDRLYWTNIPVQSEIPKSDLVFKDVIEKNVDEKYFYKRDFELFPGKRVAAKLNLNTMNMNKKVYSPDFKICTLTCINGGYHEKKILDNGRPRKLTEIEYERCQGLPDNYTNVVFNGRKLSYSKRCSLCGNGWTLPVIKFILSGLLEDNNEG